MEGIDCRCPYFKGAAMEGRKPSIKCTERFTLVCFGEDVSARDKRVKDVCCGDFRNCRAYIMRQLEEAGVGILSYWTDEEASLELAKLRGEEVSLKTYYTKCGREFNKQQE